MLSSDKSKRRGIAKTDRTSVILYATFTASAGNVTAVAARLSDYVANVRKETGNVLFEASCNADEPGSFFVYEEYADEAAFQTHLNAPYGAPFNAALAPLIVEPQPRLTFLRRIWDETEKQD